MVANKATYTTFMVTNSLTPIFVCNKINFDCKVIYSIRLIWKVPTCLHEFSYIAGCLICNGLTHSNKFVQLACSIYRLKTCAYSCLTIILINFLDR
jgi:hypothetical protein